MREITKIILKCRRQKKLLLLTIMHVPATILLIIVRQSNQSTLQNPQPINTHGRFEVCPLTLSIATGRRWLKYIKNIGKNMKVRL
jgi:hypothetical protein